MLKQYISGKDLILISACALLGAVMCAFLLIPRQAGAYIEVRVDGKTVDTLPLDEDREYRIEGTDGIALTLRVSGGAACVSSSDCRDHLCMGMGSISSTGRSIVCMPARIVLRAAGVQAEDDAYAVDLIVGGMQ